MENSIYKKPNVIELESLRSDLIEKTLATSSNNFRLFLYSNYFDQVLALNNQNLEEAFIKEFLDDYISCISKFEVWGTDPEITKRIIKLLKSITQLRIASENLASLKFEFDRIGNQLEKLNLILEGKYFEDSESAKAFFPLIDNDAPEGFYGIIESVTVRISKTVDNDKFIIVPSEKEIEKKILEQCKNSWVLALKLSKDYTNNIFKYHDIIVSFDKKHGFYEGNSLGIALTLSFLEQILKFYNSAYIIKIKEQSTFTGGVSDTGEVSSVSEEIIKKKVSAVFFSETDSFVFPKVEETYAYFTLTQLKNYYPNRKLKLIPIEEINDTLNRRDIVDIKKQKLVVRGGKFVRKNWISAVATLLLAILFAYLFVMDFDNNPASLSADGKTLFVKNIKGRVLWTKYTRIPVSKISGFAKIVDINDDGENEMLICNEVDEATGEVIDQALITCLNSGGEKVWQYTFNDIVQSREEIIGDEYGIKILDTVSFNGVKSLFLFSSSLTSFSSAIYRINLSTGKRLPGTFWSSGHVVNGKIIRLNNIGDYNIIGLGYDNGYENVVLFEYKIDTLTKVRPTKNKYLITNYPVANMKYYIRIPKNDYDVLMNSRTPLIWDAGFEQDLKNNEYKFNLTNRAKPNESLLGYEIRKDFKSADIIVNSDFRVERDSLVKKGILDEPFTDTNEYIKLLKSKILYWENGKWVNREEVD